LKDTPHVKIGAELTQPDVSLILHPSLKKLPFIAQINLCLDPGTGSIE
jgi:hypothetical protein